MGTKGQFGRKSRWALVGTITAVGDGLTLVYKSNLGFEGPASSCGAVEGTHQKTFTSCRPTPQPGFSCLHPQFASPPLPHRSAMSSEVDQLAAVGHEM